MQRSDDDIIRDFLDTLNRLILPAHEAWRRRLRARAIAGPVNLAKLATIPSTVPQERKNMPPVSKDDTGDAPIAVAPAPLGVHDGVAIWVRAIWRSGGVGFVYATDHGLGVGDTIVVRTFRDFDGAHKISAVADDGTISFPNSGQDTPRFNNPFSNSAWRFARGHKQESVHA